MKQWQIGYSMALGFQTVGVNKLCTSLAVRKTSLVILDCSAMPEMDFTIVQVGPEHVVMFITFRS